MRAPCGILSISHPLLIRGRRTISTNLQDATRAQMASSHFITRPPRCVLVVQVESPGEPIDSGAIRLCHEDRRRTPSPSLSWLGACKLGLSDMGLDGLGPLVPHGPRLRFAPWLSNEVIHMSMISSPSPASSQAQANWSRPRLRHADRPPSSRRHVVVRGWCRPNLVRYRHPAWPLLSRCGILCTQLSTREV